MNRKAEIEALRLGVGFKFFDKYLRDGRGGGRDADIVGEWREA